MNYPYTRIYSDTDGESHFETVKVGLEAADYAPPAPPLWVSEGRAATKWMIVTGTANWDGKWHPSPVRQFMVFVSGEFEMEGSDGERRVFKPGDVLMPEDLEGKGHYTRIPDSGDLTVFVVHLA